MNQVSGRLEAIGVDEAGPIGTVDVRGARVRVPLLLTPDARVGDLVLIDSGIAVAVLNSELPHMELDQG
jgi:hydrogenase maturation factor